MFHDVVSYDMLYDEAWKIGAYSQQLSDLDKISERGWDFSSFLMVFLVFVILHQFHLPKNEEIFSNSPGSRLRESVRY